MREARPYYEAYDERYKQIHTADLQWFSDSPSKIVGETMARYGVSTASEILEIGCGEGRDAAYLRRKGYRVLATDVSPAAIAFCWDKFPEISSSFQVMDCLHDRLKEHFDFIYAVCVLHMLVLDEDRKRFYQFLYEQLKEKGIALICTLSSEEEWQTDISEAFALQKRTHGATGKDLYIAGTSCRVAGFSTLKKELAENHLVLLESGRTSIEPDFPDIRYLVVKRSSAAG